MGGCVSDCTQRDVQVLAPPEETSLDLQNLGSIVPTGRAIFLGPAPVEPRDSPDFVPLDIAYLHCCGYRAKLWLRTHERTSAAPAPRRRPWSPPRGCSEPAKVQTFESYRLNTLPGSHVLVKMGSPDTPSSPGCDS